MSWDCIFYFDCALYASEVDNCSAAVQNIKMGNSVAPMMVNFQIKLLFNIIGALLIKLIMSAMLIISMLIIFIMNLF